jgi:quercetin dioxygenase-like cupin family protein
VLGERFTLQLRLPSASISETGRFIMANDEPVRRDVLLALATAPFVALAQAGEARAQVGVSPVKVDTNGLVAKIKFEAPLDGFLKDINGKYKLRVTELTLAPGGHVGEHNHEGPGIRQVTSGYMTYVLPDRTVVYGPGDFFFESGDINHTVFNRTDAPMVHVLFEILPANLNGPSLIPVRHH